MPSASPSLMSQASSLTLAAPKSPSSKSDIASLADTLPTIDVENNAPSTKELSFTRLFIVHAALAVCLFLSITDTTIVSTSLPTISAELNGNTAQYSWVGVSYLLTQTIFQPIYGQFCMIFGRKRVLYTCLILFLSTSGLCGGAQSMTWLFVARALQGVGGGGIVTLVWVILDEVAPAKTRHRWNSALTVVWSSSALAGPLLGGVFSDLVSWRWAFYINLPVGCAALAAAALSLSTWEEAPCSQLSTYELLATFDWTGLVLLVGGTACLVLGFVVATLQGWFAAVTLVLVISGILSLAAGMIFESGVLGESLSPNPKHALLAPRLLQTRTTGIILVFSFFQTAAFNAGTFYLALFYQAVHGSSALLAGIELLPYTLGSSLVSLVGFYLVEKTKAHNAITRVGLGIMTAGFGLMILLNEHSSIPMQTLIPLVAGVGVGLLLKTPVTALASAMPGHSTPVVTGGLFFIRFIGASSGVSVGGAIYESRLAAMLPSGHGLNISSHHFDYRTLTALEPESRRNEVLLAVSQSVQSIWIACTLCLGIGFILSLFMQYYPENSSPDNETLS